MGEKGIAVTMLGGFSITWGNHRIDDNSNRSRKSWLLLAYMIFRRKERLTQENFLSLLQSKDSDNPADPVGSLKAALFRTRAMLDRLGEGAGHRLILRREGSYAWNNEIPVVVDAEEFERLCREGDAAQADELRLERYRQALALYRGDFLPKLSTESWVMPLTAYYHRIYLETTEKTLSLLSQRQLWEEAAVLCRQALSVEPYSEELYRHAMRCQIAMGQRDAAVRTYEEMSELLFSTFGVMPSEESRQLYRLALSAAEHPMLPVEEMQAQLRESDAAKGALFCEYDFFRLFYQAQARGIARNGDTIHIALLSVHGKDGKELSRRSLERAMENLKELVLGNLRQGDVVTQCSASQYIIMLPQANYENSSMVCARLIRAFFRQYPHSPIDIRFSVHPLEPTGFMRGS